MGSPVFRGFKLPKGWLAFDDSLLVNIADVKNTASKPAKIAGFDFDDTLVRKHDHSLAFPNVMEKLKNLYQDGYVLAIFSNESLDRFKKPQAVQKAVEKKLSRLDQFARNLGVPIQILVATKYDSYRKPSTQDEQKKKPRGGKQMWTKLQNLLQLDYLDLQNSFYVGDATGKPGTFSDADLSFATCVGVKFADDAGFFRSTEPVFWASTVKREADITQSSSKKRTATACMDEDSHKKILKLESAEE